MKKLKRTVVDANGGNHKEDARPTKEEFLKVYKFFVGNQDDPDNVFVGSYDAYDGLGRRKYYSVGIYIVMSILADLAGELEAFMKMWGENEAKSEEKVKELKKRLGM